VRVTRSDHGFEVDGSSDGRGAWLCRTAASIALVDRTCLEQALVRRAFGRAWKRTLGEAEEQALREQLARVDDEHPDAH
jgi:predicted RNA-binding protein YlxR (DUF448 family)